jgi:probable F420-dependent oxidoreductase
MNFGVDIALPGVPLHTARSQFEELRDLGYTQFWSSEVSNEDAFTPLTLAAAWTPEIDLGTAIVPVFTRGPGLLAMTAAALADAAPGRFTLGVGTSSINIVQKWNGLPFVDPYKRTRDTVRFLRHAFTGERVDETYDTFEINGFRLGRVPEIAPRLLVAALRPQMLRLAGREADGVICTFAAPKDLLKIIEQVGPGKEIVCKIFLCPNAEPEAFYRDAKRIICAYLTVDVYARYQEWLGRGDVLQPVWDAWAAGDRKAALAAVPDALVDEFFLHGTPEECWAGVERYLDAGVTKPILEVHEFGVDLREGLRAMGPARRPPR